MKAHKIYIILVAVFFIGSLSQTFSQSQNFVTLKGNKFICDGQQFYPVVMNYCIDIVKDVDGQYYIAPHHSYFNSNDYEGTHTDWLNKIKQDFIDLESQHFNTVRILGLAVDEHKIYDANPVSCPALHCKWTGEFTDYLAYGYTDLNITGDDCLKWNSFNQLTSPYSTFFGILNQLFSAADQTGMKVILLTGGGNVCQDHRRAEYTNYLTSLAANFKNTTSLMAYDFYNEPVYFAGVLEDVNHMVEYTTSDINPNKPFECDTNISIERERYGKQVVCNMVTSWNDAVKASTAYQMTTIGLGGTGEVFSWDPAILKLDFISLHTYPGKFIENTPEYANKQMYINQALSDIKWTSSTSTLPWIIGETGLSVSNDPAYQSDEGTTQDQTDYANSSLVQCRDCGGTGYSWWQYKDVLWGNPVEDYFGLKTRTSPETFKPAAQAFVNFQPFNAGTSCLTPSNYYNYNNHFTYALYGKVIDPFGSPIANALIGGWDNNWIYYFTYSKSDGTFTLYSKTLINNGIQITATAGDVINDWSPSSNPNNPKSYYLPRYNTAQNQNLSISGQTYQTGSSYYPEAWNTITVSNSTVDGNGSTGAVCVMKAGQKIDLTTGFLAKKGSYYHAYNGPLYVNCSDLPGGNTKIHNPILPAETSSLYEDTKDENGFILVFPNPSNGNMKVNYTIADENKGIFEIYDLSGQKLYSYELSGSSGTLNISQTDLDAGVYFYKATAGDKVIASDKLVIIK